MGDGSGWMQVALAGAGKAGSCAAWGGRGGGEPAANEAEDAGEDAGQQE